MRSKWLMMGSVRTVETTFPKTRSRKWSWFVCLTWILSSEAWGRQSWVGGAWPNRMETRCQGRGWKHPPSRRLLECTDDPHTGMQRDEMLATWLIWEKGHKDVEMELMLRDTGKEADWEWLHTVPAVGLRFSMGSPLLVGLMINIPVTDTNVEMVASGGTSDT